MAVGEIRATTRPRNRVAALDRVFSVPVWLFGVVGLAGATLLHGYHRAGSLESVETIARDPFHQNLTQELWLYQQPVGPMLAWALHLTTPNGIAAVHFACTVVVVLICVWLVARWVSDMAARLFVVAWFCSAQAWAAVAALGVFDILTVGALTLAMVAPTAGIGFVVGVFLGFQNFEQAAFAMILVGVFRVAFRNEPRRLVWWTVAGVIVGKLALTVYLSVCRISQSGRLDFVVNHRRYFLDGIRGQEGVLLWAVFGVLWVPVVWMFMSSDRRHRELLGLMMAVATVPVLLTYDLSRVYRNLTWPIVILVVLWCVEHRDRRLVQRGAMWLVLAACVVPTIEVIHSGASVRR